MSVFNDDEAPAGLRVRRGSIGGSSVVVLSWPIVDGVGPMLEGLSAAERSVIEGLLEGLTYAELSRVRGTSLGTVKKQVAGVYRKLGVGSRAELAARLGGRG
ncbi:MAG: helix-turn-helix transcriptional regulator [Polyangiales bacterium]